MFCEKCGTSFDDNSTYCPKCGSKLRMPSVDINNNYSQTLEKSKTTWWCNYLIRITKFVLIVEIIIAEIGGLVLIANGLGDWGEPSLVVFGICVMILGPIIAMLSNAIIMIFANMAKDIAEIKDSFSRMN